MCVCGGGGYFPLDDGFSIEETLVIRVEQCLCSSSVYMPYRTIGFKFKV